MSLKKIQKGDEKLTIANDELTNIYGGCFYIVFRGLIKTVRLVKLLFRR